MLYLVIGEPIEMALLSPQQTAQHLEQAIIPSTEAIIKLEKEKKILAGGVFAGAKGGAVIMEAASHDEVASLLTSLPFWGLFNWKVTPLESFSYRAGLERMMLKQLKAISGK